MTDIEIVNQKVSLEFIRKNYEKLNNKEIAAHLSIGISAVRAACYKMGLYRMHLEYWTDEQIEFLKNNYKTIGDKELVIIFNKKWKKIKPWHIKHFEKKRGYLKLKRSPAELKEIKKRNVARGCWNNMTTWDTRGTTQVGEVRVWGNGKYPMKVIKTNIGFLIYSRWLYEKHFGPLPEGYVVSFKDQDSMNVVPENLVAVEKGKNLRRNNKQYPEALRELEKTLKQFNKYLKQKV